MSKEIKRTRGQRVLDNNIPTPPGEKKSHGGKREGAGRKKQDKVGVKLTINADIAMKFKEKYPHKASLRVEAMMREDLNKITKQ